ncbi:hypothetical protein [Paenibacillus pini]|uniref:Uncharacterized protein n=1 Tax=Paenibacillus pini JCM 16418 TaxID=1236976 RepID=W7YQK9_9BACL|nr:hypothetical protein [Paenibacillus pini]GAF09718.1 hypothetical protein JCM16418_3872 [Paenibacillus pini JCM 16418]
MIRNRSFMTGLGIGLLIGALLLQLMLMGQGQSVVESQNPQVKLTKEQLEEQASAMKLKIVDPKDQLLTQEEWKQKVISDAAKAKESGVKTPTNGGAAKQPSKPTEPKQPKDNEKQTDITSDKPVSTNKPDTPKTPSSVKIEYKISDGKFLQDVAEDLKKAGVISDTNQFIQKGRSKKMSTKIQSGTYYFEPGEDFNSILSKITAKPAS